MTFRRYRSTTTASQTNASRLFFAREDRPPLMLRYAATFAAVLLLVRTAATADVATDIDSAVDIIVRGSATGARWYYRDRRDHYPVTPSVVDTVVYSVRDEYGSVLGRQIALYIATFVPKMHVSFRRRRRRHRRILFLVEEYTSQSLLGFQHLLFSIFFGFSTFLDMRYSTACVTLMHYFFLSTLTEETTDVGIVTFSSITVTTTTYGTLRSGYRTTQLVFYS